MANRQMHAQHPTREKGWGYAGGGKEPPGCTSLVGELKPSLVIYGRLEVVHISKVSIPVPHEKTLLKIWANMYKNNDSGWHPRQAYESNKSNKGSMSIHDTRIWPINQPTSWCTTRMLLYSLGLKSLLWCHLSLQIVNINKNFVAVCPVTKGFCDDNMSTLKACRCYNELLVSSLSSTY